MCRLLKVLQLIFDEAKALNYILQSRALNGSSISEADESELAGLISLLEEAKIQYAKWRLDRRLYTIADRFQGYTFQVLYRNPSEIISIRDEFGGEILTIDNDLYVWALSIAEKDRNRHLSEYVGIVLSSYSIEESK